MNIMNTVLSAAASLQLAMKNYSQVMGIMLYICLSTVGFTTKSFEKKKSGYVVGTLNICQVGRFYNMALVSSLDVLI